MDDQAQAAALLESIRVGSELDYETACQIGAPPEFQDQLRALGVLLAHRRGWHFDLDDDFQPLWSWGAFGASLFNITVASDGRYRCFDYSDDSVSFFGSVDDVDRWLSERSGVSDPVNDSQRQLMRADDWQLLRNLRIDIDITWADDNFVGTVRQFSDEPVISPTITGILTGCREAACLIFHAPLGIATDVRVTATLDTSATAQIVVDTDSGGLS